MTRDQRSAKAHAHFQDIKQRMAPTTELSVKQTKVYGPGKLDEPAGKRGGRITLVNKDSVSCLFDYKHDGKVCILNYASYKNPGGFFLGGSAAHYATRAISIPSY